MKSKPRYTPETVEVQPIDMARLNTAINEHFHKDGRKPANVEYRANGVLALMSQPKLCIIDDEFVGHGIVSDTIVFYIYEEESHPDGHTSSYLHPTYELSVPLVELDKFLKPPVTLAEFAKSRRGYNSRIQANEGDWVRYLNRA